MNNRLYGNLIFELSQEGRSGYSLPKNRFGSYEVPASMRRKEDAALPECDEMTVVRHYTNLSANNFGVDNGFYPLGSCTMKYNPKINEEVAALPQFAALHPLQPAETVQGAEEVCKQLCKSLCELTGLYAFTLKPFAGAHGELTGLMVIKKYHESRGDEARRLVIVPDSAHGTNPASAAVCGLDIVEVKSLSDGTVDVEALKELLAQHGSEIAAMMMTNPNTLGLFEKQIPEIEKLVHAAGGLMYYDGANLNPMLGAARPGDMGFDVMHINLHKTFSTPHGGGGPGAGPVGVRKGLEPFFPEVSPYHGNFAVAMRALAYILSLGRENIKLVGPLATLNANYINESLKVVFGLAPRITLASLAGYLCSQNIDVFLYHLIWKRTGGSKKMLWLRNNGSTLTSQAIDTVIFTTLAFWGVYPKKVFISILLTTYLFKAIVALMDTPFMYLSRRIRPIPEIKGEEV